MTITKISSKKLTLFSDKAFTIGRVYPLTLRLPCGRFTRRINCRVKITDVTGGYVTGNFVALLAEDVRFLKERYL